MKWQPIETAPRDGTRMILAGHFGIACGAWGCIETWSNRQKLAERWQWNVDGEDYPGDPPPTHWMPLPEPPTQPEAGEP